MGDAILLIVNIPSFSIFSDTFDFAVEFGAVIDSSLFTVTLDIFLKIWTTRELFKILFRFVSESREFVEFMWNLKFKVGVILSPNTSYVRLFLDKSAF